LIAALRKGCAHENITIAFCGSPCRSRGEPSVAFAESEPTVEEPESASPSAQSIENNEQALTEEKPTGAARLFQNERTTKPS